MSYHHQRRFFFFFDNVIPMITSVSLLYVETDGSDCTAHFGAFKRDGVVRSTEDLIMSHFNASVTILKLVKVLNYLRTYK